MPPSLPRRMGERPAPGRPLPAVDVVDGLAAAAETVSSRLERVNDGAADSVACTRDAKIIVSGGGDGAVKVWNNSGQLLSTLAEAKNPVTSVAVSPSGDAIYAGTASASGAGEVHHWKLKRKADAVEAARRRVSLPDCK